MAKKRKNSRGSSRQITTIQSFTAYKAGRCTGLSTNPHLSGVWFPPCKVDIKLPAFGDHLSIGKGNGCELPRPTPGTWCSTLEGWALRFLYYWSFSIACGHYYYHHPHFNPQGKPSSQGLRSWLAEAQAGLEHPRGTESHVQRPACLPRAAGSGSAASCASSSRLLRLRFDIPPHPPLWEKESRGEKQAKGEVSAVG